MDIIEHAKKEDLSKRIIAFQSELRELTIKHNLTIKPQISPDGPIISIIDIKNENNSIKSESVNPITTGTNN